ncbi:MAG: GNAT family N-acetyltransferase [Treponema sp.]|nr:GNAT family N-acetyltransferase [Treponema sp.]
MISEEEFLERYDIQKLEDDVDIKSFDCGDDDLNDFIISEVAFYKKQLIAMPYVIIEKNNPEILLAYFTLSNDKIAVTDFSSNSQFNKFKRKNFNREKFLRSYPSVKIGRLGISKQLQGKGIGTHVIDFIKLYFLEDNKTGCRFITVDAYNAAVPFYEKNGFRFLQKKDDSPTQLMYFDLMNVIDTKMFLSN